MGYYEEACDVLNCWYNSDGFCNSIGDLRNVELGADCPDYIPDGYEEDYHEED